MRSRAYWIARAAALEAVLQNAAAEVTAETVAAYERAIEAINTDIRDTFSAYVANDIPEDEAVKLLNAAESDKTYAELMQIYAETTDAERRAEILARVNAQAYGARISRLEGVKSRVLIEMTRAANVAVTAHKTLYTKTLQKSYYTTVYNIAEGLNCGVDFSLLPTRAINAALKEPWNGANYSDRIWNHNDRFTEAVQNTVTTGIMAGHSVNRMAAQLEEYAKSESADGILYSTTRLVRTETAHFMNTGQKAAYDEIGIKKYRFVAALSERTCETCGSLDGQVFEVKAAREGINYPPIHPNCRCTTIMGDAISKTRIARDPETGKNYKVDGDMTFEEWKASLTDEQREAMKAHVRQMRNKSADKKQYERYTKVLGDSAPKAFDKFIEIKYNNNRAEYEDLKGFYSYKKSEPTAEFMHYKIYRDLKGEGINNGKVLPPEKISAYILKDETARREPYHIMHRMKERQITDDEVRHYKDDALVMFSQWQGTRKAYYSRDGVSVITPNPEQWVFKTAWKKEDFDARTEKIIEVINRYVK